MEREREDTSELGDTVQNEKESQCGTQPLQLLQQQTLKTPTRKGGEMQRARHRLFFFFETNET